MTEKEYVVTFTATFRGCESIIKAPDALAARAFAMKSPGDIDTARAEISDWTVTRVEENA